jgi:hypothetical protein
VSVFQSASQRTGVSPWERVLFMGIVSERHRTAVLMVRRYYALAACARVCSLAQREHSTRLLPHKSNNNTHAAPRLRYAGQTAQATTRQQTGRRAAAAAGVETQGRPYRQESEVVVGRLYDDHLNNTTHIFLLLVTAAFWRGDSALSDDADHDDDEDEEEEEEEEEEREEEEAEAYDDDDDNDDEEEEEDDDKLALLLRPPPLSPSWPPPRSFSRCRTSSATESRWWPMLPLLLVPLLVLRSPSSSLRRRS